MIWGQFIQFDLVTWPSKVGSHYLHIMWKKDEEIDMTNFMELRTVVFLCLQKKTPGGGVDIRPPPHVGVQVCTSVVKDGEMHELPVGVHCHCPVGIWNNIFSIMISLFCCLHAIVLCLCFSDDHSSWLMYSVLWHTVTIVLCSARMPTRQVCPDVRDGSPWPLPQIAGNFPAAAHTARARSSLENMW